ncbi:hypothetical protein LshimejAT787_2400090 [Lyophyllum shimeji]|uniref:Uncharacterized protein n=1 Tax=Lyophyllum shimeji TaxID=47721 RepID=A0A9P3UWX0_LYOSH|nr:hypothetical protein LshimejAT787_2400090 [Lyophyllum shimeji]
MMIDMAAESPPQNHQDAKANINGSFGSNPPDEGTGMSVTPWSYGRYRGNQKIGGESRDVSRTRLFYLRTVGRAGNRQVLI